ncbi:MAG: BMP family ABC transporter substrate-binding protein [Deltaproteobacteria bacterium]|nr:BMP family ABC transporter substrate-binding protein [Deltaproteobacteria bacterium]
MRRFFLFIACWLAFEVSGAPLRVGLVLDKGGVDDKSFNAAAVRGATEAKEKLGIQLKMVTASDDAAIEPSLRTFARHGYPLVIGIGFVQVAAMKKVAPEYPKTHFLVVDSVVEAPNVRSITFKEHEGSYLVGAIAALTTKTGMIGFIGGMDIPLIRRFEMGYKAGAKSVSPNISVISNYVGSTSDAWKNPTKGKELAISQYQKKVDITFAAAGASGLGVFDAAEEMKKYVIGCDSNQNGIKPGRVLTSMLKRVDLAVYKTIELEQQGKFQPGKTEWGIADGGIDFVIDSFNRSLISPQVEQKANELKSEILSGKTKVPDYYESMRGVATHRG